MRPHPTTALQRGAVIAIAIATVSCAGPPEPGDSGAVRIANPASVHCAQVGGRAVTETRPDGSEFGVCLFADNRQCGQWALFRGTCPLGGLSVAGYPSDAARRCVITGGRYAATGTRETCTTPGGSVCDLEAYDRGGCR